MKSQYLNRLLIIIAIIAANVGCDQGSKKIVREKVKPQQTINVIKDNVTITNVENTGAFLSLGTSMPSAAKSIILSLLPMVVIGFVFRYVVVKKDMSPLLLVALCFIIGGGIGNIFDRVVYGSVTDFMHVKLGVLETGIFNMADLSIMTGTFMVLLQAVLKRKQHYLNS